MNGLRSGLTPGISPNAAACVVSTLWLAMEIKGAYEVGNVKIIPHVQNIKDRRFTAETLERMSRNRIGGPHLGPKVHSENTKQAMSVARSKYWARKKAAEDGRIDI